MNKKAQLLDLLYMGFILVMIIVFGLIIYYVVDEYRTSASGDIDSTNIGPVNDYIDRFPAVLSGLFIIVLVGISIIALASAFFVNSHPIFYGLMMFVLAFLAWINAIYSNFWYDFSTKGEWAALAANLPIINTVMKFYPIILFVIGLIIGIAMIAKGD